MTLADQIATFPPEAQHIIKRMAELNRKLRAETDDLNQQLSKVTSGRCVFCRVRVCPDCGGECLGERCKPCAHRHASAKTKRERSLFTPPTEPPKFKPPLTVGGVPYKATRQNHRSGKPRGHWRTRESKP